MCHGTPYVNNHEIFFQFLQQIFPFLFENSCIRIEIHTAAGSLKIWAGDLVTGPSFSFTFSTSPPWSPAESCSPPPQLTCTPPPASALPPYPSSPGPLGGWLPSGSCCLTYSAIVEVNPPTPGSSHTWLVL